MPGSTALALIAVDILVGIPLVLLLLPSNRHFIARLVRETREAAVRKKEGKRRL